jgi:hypothetical protein
MGKFVFPVDSTKLASELRKNSTIAELLRPLGAEDNVSFFLSCARGGYVNKMHHKTRQEEDRALLELVKTDPEMKRRLEGKIQSQAKKVG